MKYTARRPFASFNPGSKLVETGEVIEINNKKRAEDLQNKGLIWPHYSTKEDKRAVKIEKKSKVTIKHDSGPMFFVLRGNDIIDRLKKSEAEKLRDRLNDISS